MSVKFEWDEVKAEANRRKHGVSFELAALAFSDPFALSEQDRIEGNELRWRTLGMVRGRHLLIVAHTTRAQSGDGAGFDIIRIISARSAVRAERRRYEEEYR